MGHIAIRHVESAPPGTGRIWNINVRGSVLEVIHLFRINKIGPWPRGGHLVIWAHLENGARLQMPHLERHLESSGASSGHLECHLESSGVIWSVIWTSGVPSGRSSGDEPAPSSGHLTPPALGFLKGDLEGHSRVLNFLTSTPTFV